MFQSLEIFSIHSLAISTRTGHKTQNRPLTNFDRFSFDNVELGDSCYYSEDKSLYPFVCQRTLLGSHESIFKTWLPFDFKNSHLRISFYPISWFQDSSIIFFKPKTLFETGVFGPIPHHTFRYAAPQNICLNISNPLIDLFTLGVTKNETSYQKVASFFNQITTHVNNSDELCALLRLEKDVKSDIECRSLKHTGNSRFTLAVSDETLIQSKSDIQLRKRNASFAHLQTFSSTLKIDRDTEHDYQPFQYLKPFVKNVCCSQRFDQDTSVENVETLDIYQPELVDSNQLHLETTAVQVPKNRVKEVKNLSRGKIIKEKLLSKLRIKQTPNIFYDSLASKKRPRHEESQDDVNLIRIRSKERKESGNSEDFSDLRFSCENNDCLLQTGNHMQCESLDTGVTLETMDDLYKEFKSTISPGKNQSRERLGKSSADNESMLFTRLSISSQLNSGLSENSCTTDQKGFEKTSVEDAEKENQGLSAVISKPGLRYNHTSRRQSKTTELTGSQSTSTFFAEKNDDELRELVKVEENTGLASNNPVLETLIFRENGEPLKQRDDDNCGQYGIQVKYNHNEQCSTQQNAVIDSSKQVIPPFPTGIIEQIPSSKYHRFLFVPMTSIRRSVLLEALETKLKTIADKTKTFIDPFKEVNTRRQGIIIKGYYNNVQEAIGYVQQVYAELAELQKNERRVTEGGNVRQKRFKSENGHKKRRMVKP